MEIHLDPVGGMAGDMFIAALLHAFPELEARVRGAIAAVEPAVADLCHLRPHNDGVLAGARFTVGEPAAPGNESPAHEHGHHHHHGAEAASHRHSPGPDLPHLHPHAHGHTPWAVIRGRLERASLDPEVRAHAVGIFTALAGAEARVHGIGVDAVAFHEVGAADSIADIVGAGALIAALGGNAGNWSVGALPLGSGLVRTDHGFLPVPAPATALLLEGFLTVDDEVPGERVTPTGAAILSYLNCRAAAAVTGRSPRVLGRTGIGFGARKLPGRSNCLRVLAFAGSAAAVTAGPRREEVAVIEFETDDQSPEDLALGLERLRAEPGVLDLLQAPAFGKKGRLVTCVRVLARPEALETVAAACFRETTTIGLRHQTVERLVLERRAAEVEVEGRTFRVKTVVRPGHGQTAKLEAADLDDLPGGQGERTRLRAVAERMALDREAADHPH